MIESFSDLLQEIKRREVEEISSQFGDLDHPGMIGDMYEGLTKALLDRALFKGLDLKVEKGKIRGADGTLSKQIDCMIVAGTGTTVKFTEHRIYDIGQVVAVIEVKKNLFSSDLESSYQNLLSVSKLASAETVCMPLLRDAYSLCFGRELPTQDELDEFSWEDQLFFHTIVSEVYMPARIVFGYDGFANEYSLRQHFNKYLEKNITTSGAKQVKGFGPTSFPNLIMCGEYSLIKMNGIPYGNTSFDEKGYHFYASYGRNPILLLLEIIWTRLSYLFDVPNDVFGDDITTESLNAYLACQPVKFKDFAGWRYRYIPTDNSKLRARPKSSEWQPFFANDIQYVVIHLLINRGEYKFDDESIEYLKSNGYTPERLSKELRDAGIAYKNRHNELVLLTKECVAFILPDGRFAIGENKTGRVSRWVAKYMNHRNSQP